MGRLSRQVEDRSEGNSVQGGERILESANAVNWIEERCGFIAPVKKYPEQEALAFAQAALKVLRGEEKAWNYEISGD